MNAASIDYEAERRARHPTSRINGITNATPRSGALNAL